MLPGHTYQYRVQAANLGGISAWATSAVVTVPTIPAAPSSLTALLQPGPQVALSFTDNATNEDGFVVERAVDGGAFALFTSPAANPGTGVVNLAADTSVLPGHAYQYRVQAANLGGASAWATSAVITVPSIPAAPTGTTATLRPGPAVRVTWTDNSGNETGFVIQRATDAAFTLNVGTFSVGPNVTTLTQSGLTLNTTYYYRVQAVNLSGASAWSNTASVLVVPPPAAPTGLTATLLTGRRAQLQWTDNATTETQFIVQRAIGFGAFTQIATVPALTGTGTVTYTDSGLNPGVTYRYRVRAGNGAGVSAWTNIDSVAVPTLPAAPTALTLTSQPGQVTLTWTDNATNETGFQIQRRAGIAAWITIASPAADPGTGTVTYIDTTVTPGTIYRYRVRAVNLAGASAWSNTVPITAI